MATPTDEDKRSALVHASAWEHAAFKLGALSDEHPEHVQLRFNMTHRQAAMLSALAASVAEGYRRTVDGLEMPDDIAPPIENKT